jgi:hypothetical protein
MSPKRVGNSDLLVRPTRRRYDCALDPAYDSYVVTPPHAAASYQPCHSPSDPKRHAGRSAPDNDSFKSMTLKRTCPRYSRSRLSVHGSEKSAYVVKKLLKQQRISVARSQAQKLCASCCPTLRIQGHHAV